MRFQICAVSIAVSMAQLTALDNVAREQRMIGIEGRVASFFEERHGCAGGNTGVEVSPECSSLREVVSRIRGPLLLPTPLLLSARKPPPKPRPLPKNNPYILELDQLPLRTSGSRVLDAHSKEVRLRCVNWSGAQLLQAHVGGLNVQRLEIIPQLVRASHFNCVRLVYSLDVWYNNVTIDTDTLAANPLLQDQDMPPKALLKLAVAELTRNGILVILNNHNRYLKVVP